MKVKSKIWIEKDGESIFGYGKLRLLDEIYKTKSINKASFNLGISYRKAWAMVNAIEKRMGFIFVKK